MRQDEEDGLEMAPTGASRPNDGSRGRGRADRAEIAAGLTRSGRREEDEEPRSRLVTRPAGLCKGDRGNAESASAMAALLLVVTTIGFQVVCVYEGQCFARARDVAVHENVSRLALPVGLVLFLVFVPMISGAADAMQLLQRLEVHEHARKARRGAPGDDDSSQRRKRLRELSRHRRAILRAMFLSAVAAGLLAIVALIALESADRETLRRQTQKQWDTYNGLAKFHYGDIDELTTTRYRNMMHVVILCASEALVLLAATLLFGNDQFGRGIRCGTIDIC